ncbi:hypothetical protein [Thiomicrorhabdus aquaedulcis]|uniref:hypothetical protein n=1 Tax=Thiomicrorhabdus aquaedulcis TaxID=2211106 RepID=UPI001E312D48|nr:hypothetical protein [Thiomicrorhabdus aquaedulcis]
MTDSNPLLDPNTLIMHTDADDQSPTDLRLDNVDEEDELDDFDHLDDNDIQFDIDDQVQNEADGDMDNDDFTSASLEDRMAAQNDLNSPATHSKKPVFGQLAKPDIILPNEIYLLPVKERPFFPGQQLPVLLNKVNWNDTFNAVKAAKCKYIGLVYVDQEHHEKALPEDFSAIGTLVRIHDPKVKKTLFN